MDFTEKTISDVYEYFSTSEDALDIKRGIFSAALENELLTKHTEEIICEPGEGRADVIVEVDITDTEDYDEALDIVQGVLDSVRYIRDKVGKFYYRLEVYVNYSPVLLLWEGSELTGLQFSGRAWFGEGEPRKKKGKNNEN